jgi:hypothetical protein
MVYYSMALFMDEEGRDPGHVRTEAARMQLHEFKEQGVSRVEICSTRGCPACSRLDGKAFAISTALSEMPIPCPDCAHTLKNPKRGFCRCSWVPVTD